MKNHFIGLSIFCLAVCFLIGSWLIAEELNDSAQTAKQVILTTTSTNQEREYPQLLTRTELSFYLGISEEKVDKLGPITSGAYTESEIPYIKISGVNYFPKKAVDEWLKNVGATSVQ